MNHNFNDAKIALVGATGAVGEELLKLLAAKNFPSSNLYLFASEASKGKKKIYLNAEITINTLQPDCFKGIDIVFFSAGGKISKQYVPLAKENGALAIDNSSAFRMDPNVPLVIPEVNPQAALVHSGIISSPNCSATIMLMALYPLYQKFPIERVVVSTYQAASGAGRKAMIELQEETKSHLENTSFQRSVMPFPYAFNLFTHNSPLTESGYVEEELKMIYETRKILNDESIKISPTCIRVPVLRAHSEALYIEFKEKVTRHEAYEILSKAPGIEISEDFQKAHFPMPIDASEKTNVLCGRIREDLCNPLALHIWVVGDQLLKGAALNMLQIAELVVLQSSLVP